MVHFDRQVILSYLADAHRVLIPGGRALFHHSNYSLNPDSPFSENPHARAYMSAQLFEEYANKSGLTVLEQKIIGWGGIENLDCITLLEKPT